MKRLLPAVAIFGLLATLLVAAAPVAAQQQETTKEQDIRTLIEITRADSIGLQIGESITGQMVERLRSARPDLSQQHLEILTDETKKSVGEHLPLLMETIVSLYGERFTREEIREMNAFFRTPTGQKMVSKQGDLVTESVELGRLWGQAIVPVIRVRIDKRMQELGN